MIDGLDPKASGRPARFGRWQRWWLAVAGLALLTASATILWRRQSNAQPQRSGLDGQLTVLVRPPDRNIEPVSVLEPAAAPVKHGGAMCLDARLDEPAFLYLVWIDAAGRILPLYPWNNESLEITNADEPPPMRRATKLVFSPLLGRNWTFGDAAGTETVLLLARRSPLPAGTQIGALVKALAAAPQVADEKHVASAVRRGRGSPAAAVKMAGSSIKDAPLADFIEPLGDHFELIHAVQFAHAEDGKSGGAGERHAAK